MEESREAAIMNAVEAGLQVVYGDEMTLQLDIDTEEDFAFCKKQLKLLAKLVPYSNCTVTRSKSNKWHVYVDLKKALAREDRVTLQATLGSDRTREILNYTYAAKGGIGECFLFERKDADHELLRIK
jgi:hypothetical protein